MEFHIGEPDSQEDHVTDVRDYRMWSSDCLLCSSGPSLLECLAKDAETALWLQQVVS